MSTCFCGHVVDEHQEGPVGNPMNCLVEGCRCIGFDWDEDADEDEDDD